MYKFGQRGRVMEAKKKAGITSNEWVQLTAIMAKVLDDSTAGLTSQEIGKIIRNRYNYDPVTGVLAGEDYQDLILFLYFLNNGKYRMEVSREVFFDIFRK